MYDKQSKDELTEFLISCFSFCIYRCKFRSDILENYFVQQIDFKFY